MKYSINTYIKIYWKHLLSIQFWGLLWYKLTPKKIIKYFLAIALIENHENGSAKTNENILNNALKYVEQ